MIQHHIWWHLVTVPPMILWAIAAITVVPAAAPVTRERLNRFAKSNGLTITPDNARQVIDHVTGLRRWRLAALLVAAPLAGFTNDPFYLVLGWCVGFVLRDVRFPLAPFRISAEARVYRGAWLLTLGVAAVTGNILVADEGVTPAFLVHAAIVIVVAAAVPFSARNLGAGASSAIRDLSTRNVYLAASAIALSAALLVPGRAPLPETPEYTMPRMGGEYAAEFQTADDIEAPTCPWMDQVDAPCRTWLVNENPFPQAAPYIVRTGGAPQHAPFVLSPDRKAVVYLHAKDRRLVYQNAEGTHPLTGRLPDTGLPTVTFTRQNRYLALAGDDVRIVDTKDWSTLPIPGARKVHDLSRNGIVATTDSEVLVLDHKGRERMSLTLRKFAEDALEDTYHLRPDGGLLVVIRARENQVDTYLPESGKRVARLTPKLGADDWLGSGLGWSKRGPFLIEIGDDERVHHLDLRTGSLWRRDK
ncbi:hypothetical protein SAMN05444920_102894 [Nonomuraea solani]|uniref:Uncharacterized protein n=2 Tax=Nonomuraea solani TaxID=1144553 RepID=A0A1H5ZX46_9ACTN|nr:hypothetical protein SAMN05444920_102894 [Nonomuraea solani]